MDSRRKHQGFVSTGAGCGGIAGVALGTVKGVWEIGCSVPLAGCGWQQNWKRVVPFSIAVSSRSWAAGISRMKSTIGAVIQFWQYVQVQIPSWAIVERDLEHECQNPCRFSRLK